MRPDTTVETAASQSNVSEGRLQLQGSGFKMPCGRVISFRLLPRFMQRSPSELPFQDRPDKSCAFPLDSCHLNPEQGHVFEVERGGERTGVDRLPAEL